MDIFNKLIRINDVVDNNAKILLLTHTDLDGAAPAVIIRTAFPDQDIDVRYCNNSEMSEVIRNSVLDTSSEYDLVIVTDISVNTEDAEIIDKTSDRKKLILLDHHLTAMNLNKYDWAVVQSKHVAGSCRNEKYSSSGTSLLLDYLMHSGIKFSQKAIEFADITARYDTWDWVKIDNSDPVPKDLNTLFYAIGTKRFVEHYTKNLQDPNSELFDDTARLLLEIENEKTDMIIKQVTKEYQTFMMYFGGKELKIAYVEHNRNVAAAFEAMKTDCPDADVYLCNFGFGVSIRTLPDSKITAAELAAAAGGGGHAEAGGAHYDKNIIKKLCFDTLKLSDMF